MAWGPKRGRVRRPPRWPVGSSSSLIAVNVYLALMVTGAVVALHYHETWRVALLALAGLLVLIELALVLIERNLASAARDWSPWDLLLHALVLLFAVGAFVGHLT
jgi:hypothetical protein